MCVPPVEDIGDITTVLVVVSAAVVVAAAVIVAVTGASALDDVGFLAGWLNDGVWRVAGRGLFFPDCVTAVAAVRLGPTRSVGDMRPDIWRRSHISASTPGMLPTERRVAQASSVIRQSSES